MLGKTASMPQGFIIALALLPIAHGRGESALALSVPTPRSCTFAVVGGGWAGIYAAWRLVIDERRFNASDVCLFEGSSRFGGRTYTIYADEAPELDGLNIDIGAYRFAFEQHLPADLLLGPLNMSSSCYIPSCKREPLDDNLILHRLVDPRNNMSAGYGSALRLMLRQLSAAGVQLMLQHRLVGIQPSGHEDVLLQWAVGKRPSVGDGVTRARAVFLNIPRHAFRGLSADSVVFSEASPHAREVLRCSRELYGNYTTEASVKVYLIYEDAWWLTKLGLVEGEVSSVQSDPPIYIRYHDGPVSCNASACRGALLVQYAHTLADGAEWYLQFQPDIHEPMGILKHGALLSDVHAKLLHMHAHALRTSGIDPSALAPPVSAVVGFWRHAAEVVLSPAPDPLSLSNLKSTPCLRGLSSAAYADAVRKPVSNRGIFLANNDWWLEDSGVDLMPPYWAEVSLRTAERILHDHVGLQRPLWLNSTYYWQNVLGHKRARHVKVFI